MADMQTLLSQQEVTYLISYVFEGVLIPISLNIVCIHQVFFLFLAKTQDSFITSVYFRSLALLIARDLR